MDVRVLDGPNRFFPRPAMQVELDVGALVDGPPEPLVELARRLHLGTDHHHPCRTAASVLRPAERRCRAAGRRQPLRPAPCSTSSGRAGDVVYFSLQPDSGLVRDHCRRGGRAVVLESTDAGEMIVLRQGARHLQLTRADLLPATFGGLARMNIQNALAAAGATFAAGVPLHDIRQGGAVEHRVDGEAGSEPGRDARQRVRDVVARQPTQRHRHGGHREQRSRSSVKNTPVACSMIAAVLGSLASARLSTGRNCTPDAPRLSKASR